MEEYKKVDINAYFLSYLSENKVLFGFYSLLLFTYPIHRVVLPKYYGKVISSLNKGFNRDFLKNAKNLLYIYTFTQISVALLHKAQGMLIPEFSEFSIQKIFSNLLQNKHLNYENLEVGEILAKIIKVPHIIYKYFDLVRTVIFSQILIFIVTLIHYKSISNTMVFTFLFLVIGIIILQYITYSVTMKVELQSEKEKDNIYQHFQDILNNLISIIICKHETYEKNYLHEKFKSFVSLFNHSLNLNFIMRLIFSIFNVVSFILLNIMLYKEYQSKSISKEQFISSFIVTYSIMQLFTEANYSIRLVVDMYSQVKDMENYFNKKSDLDKSMQVEKEDKSFVHGGISFQNVSYQYEENAEFKEKYAYALRDVNIDIAKNEKVAIVGQIGSGKSTLVKLLLKFFEPTKGDIFINGVNIKHISRDELYDHMFYIPQKPKLLDRTLYENIYYGFDVKDEDKEKNVQKVLGILKSMHLDQTIMDIFMEKMDQKLGNDGIRLSGGQRQMVWIIRAMLRDSKIIIFDEPTSALDQDNKHKIISMIKEIGKNKTILIVSHDNIDSEFRKITMKQGEVLENENPFQWI